MVLGNLYAVMVSLGCCSELKSHLIWQCFLGVLDQCPAPSLLWGIRISTGPKEDTAILSPSSNSWRTFKEWVMHSFWGWVCAKERGKMGSTTT